MFRIDGAKKDKINILLNPNNFYGKYSGGFGRTLLFVILTCIPIILYAFILHRFVKFLWFIIFLIPYALKMFLLTVGRENERLEAYKRQKHDIYATAKDLIKINDIHEDGCIEYTDGNIAYIITAYGFSYMSDHAYSKDLEEFLSRISQKYDIDVYGHLVVDELTTSKDDLEMLDVYTDKDFMYERLGFYKYQDTYTNEHSKLYRINFIINSYKNKWSQLKKDVDILVKSEYVQCFDRVFVCSKQQAIDIISRDITVFVDVNEMLITKYNSTNYFGSKVLYFGDDIPENMQQTDVSFEDEGRRIVDGT